MGRPFVDARPPSPTLAFHLELVDRFGRTVRHPLNRNGVGCTVEQWLWQRDVGQEDRKAAERYVVGTLRQVRPPAGELVEIPLGDGLSVVATPIADAQACGVCRLGAGSHDSESSLRGEKSHQVNPNTASPSAGELPDVADNHDELATIDDVASAPNIEQEVELGSDVADGDPATSWVRQADLSID
jgi:hypothetical protein